jgi:hypothetical protein
MICLQTDAKPIPLSVDTLLALRVNTRRMAFPLCFRDATFSAVDPEQPSIPKRSPIILGDGICAFGSGHSIVVRYQTDNHLGTLVSGLCSA